MIFCIVVLPNTYNEVLPGLRLLRRVANLAPMRRDPSHSAVSANGFAKWNIFRALGGVGDKTSISWVAADPSRMPVPARPPVSRRFDKGLAVQTVSLHLFIERLPGDSQGLIGVLETSCIGPQGWRAISARSCSATRSARVPATGIACSPPSGSPRTYRSAALRNSRGISGPVPRGNGIQHGPRTCGTDWS